MIGHVSLQENDNSMSAIPTSTEEESIVGYFHGSFGLSREILSRLVVLAHYSCETTIEPPGPWRSPEGLRRAYKG